MRKRLLALGMAVVFALGCTGCGSDITLTNEQNELIAEYIAGVLLKYSNEYYYNYSKVNRVASNSSSSQTTAPLQSQAASPEQTAINNKPEQTTVNGQTTAPTTPGDNGGPSSDVFGMLAKTLDSSNITVSFSKCVICNEYPEGDLVTVPSTSGKKILAVEMNVTNNSPSAVTLSGRGKGIVMQIKVNDAYDYSQMGTILNYDVANMTSFKVDAGGTQKAVALFMIPDSVATSINKIELVLTVGGELKGSLRIQ